MSVESLPETISGNPTVFEIKHGERQFLLHREPDMPMGSWGFLTLDGFGESPLVTYYTVDTSRGYPRALLANRALAEWTCGEGVVPQHTGPGDVMTERWTKKLDLQTGQLELHTKTNEGTICTVTIKAKPFSILHPPQEKLDN